MDVSLLFMVIFNFFCVYKEVQRYARQWEIVVFLLKMDCKYNENAVFVK